MTKLLAYVGLGSYLLGLALQPGGLPKYFELAGFAILLFVITWSLSEVADALLDRNNLPQNDE